MSTVSSQLYFKAGQQWPIISIVATHLQLNLETWTLFFCRGIRRFALYVANICWRDGQKRSMNAERLLRSDWNDVLYSLVCHEPLREKTSWKSSNFSLRTSLSSFLLAQPEGVLPALGQATLYDQLAQHGATLANKLRHSPGVRQKEKGAPCCPW